MWRKIIFRSTVALLVVALFTVFPLAILSLMEHRPTELGVNEGQLRPCPDRPNCVCSHASDARHAIAPIEFAGSSHEAWEKLQRVLESRPRTKIITVTDNYLHAEFTSDRKSVV